MQAEEAQADGQLTPRRVVGIRQLPLVAVAGPLEVCCSTAQSTIQTTTDIFPPQGLTFQNKHGSKPGCRHIHIPAAVVRLPQTWPWRPAVSTCPTHLHQPQALRSMNRITAGGRTMVCLCANKAAAATACMRCHIQNVFDVKALTPLCLINAPARLLHDELGALPVGVAAGGQPETDTRTRANVWDKVPQCTCLSPGVCLATKGASASSHLLSSGSTSSSPADDTTSAKLLTRFPKKPPPPLLPLLLPLLLMPVLAAARGAAWRGAAWC